MPYKNTKDTYGSVAKGLHWVTALIILGLIPLGFFMTSLEFSNFKLSLYSWHKSFGTLVLVLVALRILWRWHTKPPHSHDHHKTWEINLARLIHFLLYLALITMPLSGWLMTNAGAFPHHFFGMTIPPVIEKDEALFKFMRNIHEISSYALCLGVGLHVLGAFKHAIIDKDNTLKRMLPKYQQGFFTLLISIFFVTSMSFSVIYMSIGLIKNIKNNESRNTDIINVTLAKTSPQNYEGWTINQKKSAITFTTTAQGTAFEGRFDDFDGTIIFDPENLTDSSAAITINIGSVSTGSPERDNYITLEPWLDAQNHPQARFESTEFTHLRDAQYRAAGTLTIRGLSLPAIFDFTLDITQDDGKQIATAAGILNINRLDFKVGTDDWASEDIAGHQIIIHVKINAERAQSENK